MPIYSEFDTLTRDGFMVIQNLFDKQTINALLVDYQKFRKYRLTNGVLNKNYTGRNYTMIHGDSESTAIVKESIFSALSEIRQHTNITSNVISKIPVYFDMELIAVGWHQDHDPFYMWQNTYNSLNFWIPIIKNNSTTDGIAVAPFSKIPNAREFVNSGARDFKPYKGQMYVKDDTTDLTSFLDIDLDSIAVIPELVPGDVLVMRNDTIHKSQSFEGSRLALSVRCFFDEEVLRKEELLRGGEHKKQIISKNPGIYQKMMYKFKQGPTTLAKDIFDFYAQ